MEKDAILKMLPETPPHGLIRWAEENCREDLGPKYLVFSVESVPVMPTMAEILEYNSMAPRRSVRAALCKCFGCGNDFVTQYVPGPVKAIRMIVGEDGSLYTADPGCPTDYDCAIDVGEGDALSCPYCGDEVQVIHAGKIKGGRTKQIMVVAVETVGEYAAIIYWMVSRHIETYGDIYSAYPRDAYVISEQGNLVRFTHTSGGGAYSRETNSYAWRIASKNTDSINKQYHDWESINNRKVGGVLYPVVPDLTGTTGEKTGLEAFCKAQSECLCSYIRVWNRFRPIENLVNTGWLKLVDHIVKIDTRGYDPMVELRKVIDTTKKKPYEMLHMTKADFKALRKQGKTWDFETQQLYIDLLSSGRVRGAVEFSERLRQFGPSGIRIVIDLQRIYGDADFDKVERYLSRQRLQPREVGLLLDARNMARQIAGCRALTEEELWPRNLVAVHDRLEQMRQANCDAKTAAMYQAGFDAILEKYGGLQWTDGDLCVVLPKCNGDLIREGRILRHCVGCYGEAHIKGTDVIFFIRHYRRPERSYYTLDINMVGRPVEVQLHGYGNERHGLHKEHVHQIPKKVRDFCDHWKNEVLLPFYYRQSEEKSEKKERKTA